jgi:3'(2'), 5'-bisphosphate nucleotidase
VLREKSREHELEAIKLVLVKHDASWITHIPHMARLPSTLSFMGDDVTHDHADDGPSAIRAAEVASRLLIALRQPGAADVVRVPADQLRDRGDQMAHEAITSLLREAHPQDAILSEEAADDPRRLRADRVWIIDPLDGTREFGEQDDTGVWRDDFAVHVALWERDHGLVLGVVGLPARGEMYSSDDPPEVPPSPEGALRIAVSRSRPPAFIAALEVAGLARLVPMGSAGVKVMAVVSGEVDAYIHAGGQYQWDSAAPVAVALAAGLVATRLDGSPLRYNVPELLLPDLVVCHPDRADEVRALLDAAGFGPDGTSGAGATGASAAESAE